MSSLLEDAATGRRYSNRLVSTKTPLMEWRGRAPEAGRKYRVVGLRESRAVTRSRCGFHATPANYTHFDV